MKKTPENMFKLFIFSFKKVLEITKKKKKTKFTVNAPFKYSIKQKAMIFFKVSISNNR